MSMEAGPEGEPVLKPLKHLSGQVCQICGDVVGVTLDGDLFIACDVCAFPVCRPCYDYERKDGTQSCPQCKTRYKRHKGSPHVRGDEEEDDNADDVASDFNYPSGNQNQKQKIAEAMLQWQMSYGRGEDVAPPIYDREVSQNNIHLLTNGQAVSGELPAASPEHHTMPSPGEGGGKRVHPLPYADLHHSGNVRVVDPGREFGSQGFGNVAWKERIESWRVKPEKNVVPMSNGSHAASEGKGGGDIDASTDVNMDDALLDDNNNNICDQNDTI